jgi:tRNA threonylcarbamoyladenosine biosynthesis protein TsaE
MLHLTASSTTQLPGLATEILSFAANSRVFLFYGDMGAGKTTLIKSLCACLGVIEPVTSPTFSIVNEYTGTGQTIYHFDFYRLKNQAEALDLGFEEYIYTGNYCFIEWPEKIPALLPQHYTSIKIEVLEQGPRRFIIDKI